MRILILGDFSGHRDSLQNHAEPLQQRRLYPIDIDNFDQVLAAINPQLNLADGETLGIAHLDDFHPDGLYQNLTLFKKLRDLRKRLQDSSTAAAALAELQAEEPEPATPTSADDS
ncbi:MAG: type VI secretion system contractile sheath small subunit, partial [Gammaproteobacteria bacterium]|nr:type VI secretion system contractile sheath small subunit [Gammaproteobacteria bacterium]